MNPALHYIRANYDDLVPKKVSATGLAMTIFAGQVLPRDAEQQVIKAFAQVTRERLGYDKTESVTGRKPGRIEDDNLPTRDELKQEQTDKPVKRRGRRHETV